MARFKGMTEAEATRHYTHSSSRPTTDPPTSKPTRPKPTNTIVLTGAYPQSPTEKPKSHNSILSYVKLRQKQVTLDLEILTDCKDFGGVEILRAVLDELDRLESYIKCLHQ